MEGEEIYTVPLGGMLGAIGKLKAEKPKKWAGILDCHGSVSTFMKYKAHYYPAFDFLAKGKNPTQEQMARFICGGLFSGGTTAFDVDSFNTNFKIDEWLNTEWLGENFFDPEKFLEYESIVKLG